MSRWLVFLHVVSAFGFFLVHGATAGAMFRLKTERDPDRLRALLGVRDLADRWMGLPLLGLLATGIALGFLGRWWGRGWIWVSLGVLVFVGLLMSTIGRMYHMRIWEGLDPKGHPMSKRAEDRPPATAEQLADILASGRPWLLAVIGVAGMAIILWLMMFKPF
jgi:hypothetical protein